MADTEGGKAYQAETMPKRLDMCIKNKGGSIKY
jgi:hypothetical protein